VHAWLARACTQRLPRLQRPSSQRAGGCARHAAVQVARSHRSLMVQPAPRSSTAPAPKSASSVASGSAPGGAASAMEQKQGHASSHVPARLGQSKPVLCSKQQVPWAGCSLRHTRAGALGAHLWAFPSA